MEIFTFYCCKIIIAYLREWIKIRKRETIFVCKYVFLYATNV